MRTNIRIKYLNSHPYEIIVANRDIFENSPKTREPTKKRHKSEQEAADEVEEALADKTLESGKSTAQSQNRAKRKVFDLVAANPELDIFVTLTLDKTKIDRYDYSAIVRKLNQWLDNHVRRDGLKYVLVAEYHKDRAIHFHALMNRALELSDSGKTDKEGHQIYNLPQWSLGFTTAIETYGSRTAVCRYITKYITKSEEKVGGRWYYHGGDLNHPEFTYSGSGTGDKYSEDPDGLRALADAVAEMYDMSGADFSPAFVFEPSDSFVKGLKMAIVRRKEI